MNNSLSQATNGLLMQLVMDLKSGYLRRCESLGLAREEMQMLQGLTIEEIHYLSNSEVSVIRLDINHENLLRMLQQPGRSRNVCSALTGHWRWEAPLN